MSKRMFEMTVWRWIILAVLVMTMFFMIWEVMELREQRKICSDAKETCFSGNTNIFDCSVCNLCQVFCG